MNQAELSLRWLGVAGLELVRQGRTLLIDPHLTRPPFWNLFFGRPQSNAALLRERLPRSDAILVTHAHYDHLLDVPFLAQEHGSTVYGSTNTVRVCAAYGVPAERLREIAAGDRFAAAGFEVDVIAGRHGAILGMLPYPGSVSLAVHVPLRLDEYKLDQMFSFRIRAGKTSILIWNHPEPAGAPRADVLAVIPYWREERMRMLLEAVQPHFVLPIHWDDFFRPASRPARALTLPPGWGDWRIRRLRMDDFAARVEAMRPGMRVCLPRIFEAIEVPQAK